MKYKNLFTPVQIGRVTLKNRFALAPMGPLGLADAQGGFNQRGIDYYTERAKGGTGLIITGVTFSDCRVETQSMPNCPNSTYNPVHFIRTSREMTERVHAYGSKIFLMMSGGFGRVTIPTNLGEFPPVAPSAIPHRWLDKTCRPLTKEEIHSIVKSFGDGAYNAKRGGFDGIEVHAVHEGYLLDQFAISMFNQRTDEYGGSLENRLRFAREVVEEIKSRCGEDFPVVLRFSVKSMIRTGERVPFRAKSLRKRAAISRRAWKLQNCLSAMDTMRWIQMWVPMMPGGGIIPPCIRKKDCSARTVKW